MLKIALRIALIFGLIFGLPMGLVLGVGVHPGLALTQEQQLYNEAWRIVSRSYVDESFNGNNWWMLRQKTLENNLKDREATYGAIQRSLAKLGDPFTRLLRPDQYSSLQVSTSGELTGVGLQIAQDAKMDHLLVISPVIGSPAEVAGIYSKDQILEIDGVSTGQMSLDDAAARMRGPAGTLVNLLVRHGDDAPKSIALKRQRIALNPVIAEVKSAAESDAKRDAKSDAKSDAKRDANIGPVGYIRLNQFNANAAQEVAHAIYGLEKQGADAFLLDLRNNPGGLLQSGIEIARLWLEEGTIVYTVDRRGVLDSYQATGSAITQAPLVVLVNEGTASASEILAGALQENGRAILVGQKTFGKGLIQSLFELSDGAGLAVTVAKYETPEHHDINKLGIQPDRLVVAPDLKRDDIGTANDPQYLAALQALGTLKSQAVARAS
jgi:carboxyl-terminal processing protease